MARGTPDTSTGPPAPEFVVDYLAGRRWLNRGGKPSTQELYYKDKADALLELAKASPDKLRRLTKKAKKQKRASITGGMGPGTLDELYDENSGLYDELTRMDL